MLIPLLQNRPFDPDIKMLTQLIQLGMDPNETDCQGATVLSYATLLGELKIVRLLLQAGACPHLAGFHGKSALGIAIRECLYQAHNPTYLEIARCMIAKIPECSYLTGDHSRLQEVIEQGDIEQLATLCRVGAHIPTFVMAPTGTAKRGFWVARPLCYN